MIRREKKITGAVRDSSCSELLLYDPEYQALKHARGFDLDKRPKRSFALRSLFVGTWCCINLT